MEDAFMKQYAIKMRELDQRHRQEEGGMNLEATEALKELETIQVSHTHFMP